MAASFSRGRTTAIPTEKEIERAIALHLKPLYQLCCSILGSTDEADDIAQEAFVALCKTTQEFQSDEHVRNWLFKVASNRCYNVLRARRRHPVTSQQESGPALDRFQADQYSRTECERERLDVLWSSVQRLKPELREVIYLRYGEELGIGDIASVVGISRSAVYVRLHRARKALKQIILEARHE